MRHMYRGNRRRSRKCKQIAVLYNSTIVIVPGIPRGRAALDPDAQRAEKIVRAYELRRSGLHGGQIERCPYPVAGVVGERIIHPRAFKM